MRWRIVELLLVLPLALIAVWDGARVAIVRKATRGAPEAGGYVVLLGVLLAILILVYWFRGRSREEDTGISGGTEGLRWVWLGFAILVLYAFLIEPLGYLLSTVLFFVVYLRVFGGYRWTPIVAGSLAIAVSATYLWAKLEMMLPRGLLPWP